MLLCLHEEHAVAIAHGYAKVDRRARWRSSCTRTSGCCTRRWPSSTRGATAMPVVVLGATGPVDATKRRPWIDWIHTARDQGAIVRAVRQVGRPAGVARRGARVAAARGVARATAPHGAGVRESRRGHAGGARSTRRFRRSRRRATARGRAPRPTAARRRRTSRRCCARAQRPLLLIGRVSRDDRAWDARVQLAEALGAEGDHRPQGRRRVSDRPSAARRRARGDPAAPTPPRPSRRRTSS